MIVFEKVSKKFEKGALAASEISFEVPEGRTVVLLGGSGSGKTTILKIVNRLIEPTSGTVFFKGKDIKDRDPVMHRREIGYVMQGISLFAHMTVFENISIILKFWKWDKKKIKKRVEELLNLVDLPLSYKDKYPNVLSGGEKQRVSFLRALAADPPLLLLDECFSSLDAVLRKTLQDEFLRLQANFKKTVLFVTHDIFEAFKIADIIILLDQGKVLQVAAPNELIERPKNKTVRDFFKNHGFQLFLVTKKLGDLITFNVFERGKEKGKDFLLKESSLNHALNFFRKTEKKELPVFDGKIFLGMLERKMLHELILKGETNGR